MNTNQINGDALRRTVTLMFGPQAVDLIAKVYVAINDAQQEAFLAGNAAAWGEAREVERQIAEQNVEERIDAAFDNGYMHGSAAAEEEAGNADWEEGYLAGVQEARANPKRADETVQDIINDQAAEHFDELDECEDVWSDGAIYAAISDADWYEAHFN